MSTLNIIWKSYQNPNAFSSKKRRTAHQSHMCPKDFARWGLVGKIYTPQACEIAHYARRIFVKSHYPKKRGFL